MVHEEIDEEKKDFFRLQIGKIFDQVQTSLSNHRKNHVALYKLHTELANMKQPINHGCDFKLVGEIFFRNQFSHLFARVFPHKKGVRSADLVIKFVGAYVRFINEKVIEERQEDEDKDEEDEDEDEPETHATRFTARLLSFLREGISSKDKNVRYRVLQAIAEMISHMGGIEPDVFKRLKAELLERTNDKEADIRIQAVISLANLSDADNSEDDSDSDSDDDDDTPSIQDSLVQILARDPSSEVRRVTLMNIPINEHTFPHVLARMRDTSPTVRKALYSVILEERVKPQADPKWQCQVNYLHPRCLTIARREKIIRNGLRDTESAVKRATESLILTWLNLFDEKDDLLPRTHDGSREQNDQNQKIIALLSHFFLSSQDSIAEELLISLFNNPSIFSRIHFDVSYWENMTFEKAFLIRVFTQYCTSKKKEPELEATLPVVTQLAFYIQSTYNKLLEHISGSAQQGPDSADQDTISTSELEDRREASESTLSELLKLACYLDYTDEIGRRKMFQLVREMLRNEALLESSMLRCLDVLAEVSTKKDLVRVVVEEVQELRDNAYGADGNDGEQSQNPDVSIDESQENLSPKAARTSRDQLSQEQQLRVNVVDLKCLSLLRGMLERIKGKLDQNLSLDGVFRDLIIPSIQRKETQSRQKGLECFALYCLIDKELATRSFAYLMKQVADSPVAIKVTIMRALFDVVMKHKRAIFQAPQMTIEVFVAFVLPMLQEQEDASLKVTLCQGVSKLLYSDVIPHDELLIYLIKIFITPATQDNQELYQWLNLFFQLYSWEKQEHQRKIREAFVRIFLDVCQDRQDAPDADQIASSMLVEIFIHWTNPLQLADLSQRGNTESSDKHVDYSIQMDLAYDIIKVLIHPGLKVNISKEDRRVLCQALLRLYVPDTIDSRKIKGLYCLMQHVHQRSLGDAVAKNSFKKFEAMICKKFEKELENCSEDDLRKLDYYQDMFKFLDDIIPMSDDEDDFDESNAAPKKRRSQSTGSLAPDEDLEQKPFVGGERARKRARLSSDAEVSASKRVLPKRAAKTNAKPIQIINLEEYEEDTGSAETLTSAVSRLSVQQSAEVSVNESQLDRDISKLLDPLSSATSNTVDSIMDEDTEDEEEEVSELLVDD
ncbi:hypothetical protein CVT24_005757 [Panaeolus cyanescens]|uniref:Nuclear condensin complex subunit 3 C-terminal domain-containing protein n=1 Tax=Panaeolus cyanescens TaxID=181874 RepID=A0A409V979_9AGAR|nr:hypothetical protein CVT24_005757 [Panaeolus cyanescens]